MAGDARDGALGERRALGRERPFDVARDVVEGEPRPREPRLRLDDGVGVGEVDGGRADRERVVGREPQDGHVRAGPARGVERGRIRDDTQPAQRLKHGRARRRDRRTASA